METAYESEIQLGQLLKSLGAAFARLAKGIEPAKEQQELKDIATKLTRAKGCVARRCCCVVSAGRLASVSSMPHRTADSYVTSRRKPGRTTCGRQRLRPARES
jgi:hypothetical protein